ncbi:class I SAM-dependent methyltransferase [Clostridiaceae bacterium M8S5]|nr:class I SAM-dependent methyltransferase [Clostridiaceae bacterium M8S5]
MNKELKELWDIAYSPIKEKLFILAIEMKLFDDLKNPKTSIEIAKLHNLHEINTSIFLDALCSMNFLSKDKGLYSNTELFNEMFISNHEDYLGEFFLANRIWSDMSLDNLRDLINNGPSKVMNISSDEIWERQTRIGAVYQRLGVARVAQSIISKLPEYNNINRMLDLGAGAGMVSINLVKNHPNLRAVIVDQRAVAKVAKEYVETNNLSDRIQVIGGDYLVDDIGNNYDLVWASLTFNFYQQKLDGIVKKVYDSLNDGGTFIYFGDGIYNEGTYPKEPIIQMLTANLKSSCSLNFPRGKIAESMIDNGFRSVRSTTISTDLGDMDIDIATK